MSIVQEFESENTRIEWASALAGPGGISDRLAIEVEGQRLVLTSFERWDQDPPLNLIELRPPFGKGKAPKNIHQFVEAMRDFISAYDESYLIERRSE